MSGRAPSPRELVLVAAGGAAGSVLRHLVSGALPTPQGLPLGTLAVNLAGAFALAVVVSVLPHPSRLLLGTAVGRERRVRSRGLMGGFTTYSAFALETEALLGSDPAIGLAYLAATVLGGFCCAVLGLAAGRSMRRRPGGTAWAP